jgi:hypothetical protein
MKVVSAREFHDHTSQLIGKSKEALIITRHGKDVLGIYYPRTSRELPDQAEWDMCKALAMQFGAHLKKKGVSEEKILAQVEKWRHENKSNRR